MVLERINSPESGVLLVVAVERFGARGRKRPVIYTFFWAPDGITWQEQHFGEGRQLLVIHSAGAFPKFTMKSMLE
jgi:hypothetical protein